MGSLSIWHWLIVLLVVLVLFGSKKLPEAARGLGRSLRIFKSEIKEMQNDDAPPQQLPSAEQPNTAQFVPPQPYAQPAPPVAAPQPHPGGVAQPGTPAAQQPYPQAPQQPYQQAPQQPYQQAPQQPYQQPGTVDPNQQQ